jgi:hypothetical protein
MNSYNGIASYPSGIIGGSSAIKRRTVKSLGTVFANFAAKSRRNCNLAAVARKNSAYRSGCHKHFIFVSLLTPPQLSVRSTDWYAAYLKRKHSN